MRQHGYVPNAVNEFAREIAQGRLSRRDLLRRGAALGLSASLMGSLFELQHVAAQGAAGQPVGYSIKMPTGLPTNMKGKQITFIGSSDGPGVPFEEVVLKKFSDATGITVKRVSGAQSTTDRLRFYLQIFSTQSSDIDAAMIDVIWPGVVQPHAVDLSAVLKAENADFFPRIVENNTVGSMLVGVPWYTDAGILYYRTDLLQKYGYSAPPTTWDELETMSKKIIAGEKASHAQFTGFVFQGAAYEGLTCDGLEWQYSNGGGTIVDKDAKVTVDNDQAIAAFDRAKAWVGGISPQGVTAYQEEDARGVWQGGNSAFMRNWPYAYSLGAAKGSLIAGKFDVTTLPKGTGPDAVSTACLGGWQLMVSKYSKEQDAAKALVQYLATPEIQRSYAIERSLLPTIGSVYNDPDVLAANPYYKKLLPVFQGGAVARPSTATKDLYPDVSTAYFTALNQIITGQAGDTKTAVKNLASKIENILKDL